MDLDQRGLLPALTGLDRPLTAGAADRLEGALLGAVVGNALGLPNRHRTVSEIARRRGRVQGLPVAPPGRSAPLGAEGRLLVSWAGRLSTTGREAAPALAERLASGRPRLRQPGTAIVTTQRRLRKGVPWYAAGPDSYGNGALLRAVADGARWATEPGWRPRSAALGCLLTHAHRRAVAASVVVAELVAAGINDPDALGDPVALARTVAGHLDDPALVAALAHPGGGADTEALAVDSLADAVYRFATGDDARRAMLAAADAGGASDVVTGLVGALFGARDGVDAVPRTWRHAVGNHDRTVGRARRMAARQQFDVPQDGEERAGEEDRVHIWFLIDRSGSMGRLRQAVIDGFNDFLAEQQAMPGRARLTLVQFDGHDPYDVLVEGERLERVRPLDGRYQPRGSTPLYDAMGSLLDAAESRAADRAARGKPTEDQLVVVFTDGMENASRRWDRTEIFERVAARKADGWTFVYLGANQDSYGVGHDLGVAHGSVSDYEASAPGMAVAAASVSRATSGWRLMDHAERRHRVDDFFGGEKEAEAPLRR